MFLTKDQEIIKRGYQPYPKIINPTITFLNSMEKLFNLEYNKKKNQVSRLKISDALFYSEKFLTAYYKLHKVRYIQKSNSSKKIYIEQEISPLQLPIFLKSSDDLFNGELLIHIPKNQEYPLMFQGIILNKQITELTSGSYVHEITHSQLDSVKESIRYYQNSEILSIFNELLHDYLLDKNERILRVQDSRRIYEIFTCAQELFQYHKEKIHKSRRDLLEDTLYVSSGVKAYHLFSLFYFGNDAVKYHIINAIQQIFDGKLTVEDLLDEYEIKLNNISIKKMEKYFTR